MSILSREERPVARGKPTLSDQLQTSTVIAHPRFKLTTVYQSSQASGFSVCTQAIVQHDAKLSCCVELWVNT